ncbi:Transposon Tf2-6 polyprotein [Euphorbia peplus]|nr:Transposon Tf2-6 polyprotein [Euphorbia peplus]
MYSLMDGFSGYNQILMKIADKVKTSFITEWGTYCYKVMPFGLKNAGATYQRAATTLLHDMIHKEVEVYVDDMLVKSDTREGHPAALEKFLTRIERYNLRLNPKKCVFGVPSGKLLGHIVSDKGIEIDPEKVKAITEMPPPKTEKEVRAFLGNIQYVSRFIAKLTTVCEPIFKLLRKDETNQWNDNCQLAFDKIKKCLASAPVLKPPRLGIPLTLYLAIEDASVGAMLVQTQDDGVEHPIYYLSKKLLQYECKYDLLERTCVAMIWITRKLRHYFQSYEVLVVSKVDPMKHLATAPTLVGKLARWALLLSEFDIKFVNSKVVKGKAVAEFLARQPLPEAENESWHFEFPDENLGVITIQGWRMHFDEPRIGTGREQEWC